VLTVERESAGWSIHSAGRRNAGQFLVLHNIGIDSKATCTPPRSQRQRAQKFKPAN